MADQLQTNFASDLRSILKAVFDINCSEPLVMADNAIESGSQLYTASSNHAMGSVGVPHHIAASGSTGSPSPPLLARSASSDDDQHLEQYARSRSFQGKISIHSDRSLLFVSQSGLSAKEKQICLFLPFASPKHFHKIVTNICTRFKF